jgi:uncharacterized protein (TIGR00369 family)
LRTAFAMADNRSEPEREAALDRVRQRWQTDPFLRLLGVELESFEPGRARLRLPLEKHVLNAGQDVLHGGVASSLIDIAIGIALHAANATAGEGAIGQTTTDLNVSFLSGAREGPVTVDAQIIRRGSTLAVGEATVRDSTGAAVAVGRATFMIIRPRGDSQRMRNG